MVIATLRALCTDRFHHRRAAALDCPQRLPLKRRRATKLQIRIVNRTYDIAQLHHAAEATSELAIFRGVGGGAAAKRLPSNGSDVKLRGQGPRAEAAAARRLPAYERRDAGTVTPCLILTFRAGSAGGPKPGRVGFYVELGGAASRYMGKVKTADHTSAQVTTETSENDR